MVSSSTGKPEPGPQEIATLAATVLFAAIVSAYAGLIPLGHWQDEFNSFPIFFEHRWRALWLRMVTWSPRPLSETLLFFYSLAVEHYRSNLIAPVLSALWAMLGASAFLVPAIFHRRFPSRAAARQGVVLGLALCCLLLLGQSVAEFFYWPQSAVAYIPATAGLLAAMWLLLAGGDESAAGRRTASAMLVVSALSAEAGAIFVLGFCVLAVSAALYDRATPSKQPLGPGIWWLLAPLSAAVLVLLLVGLGRLGNSGEIFGDAKVAHHLLPSLVHAAAAFAIELVSLGGAEATFRGLLLGFASKACFFSASFLILRPLLRDRSRRSVRLLGLWGLACFGAVFLTIAAAYYQFGLVCCQRHGTFRQALILAGLVALSAVAARSPRFAPVKAVPHRALLLSMLFLIAAVAIPAHSSIPGLRRDYQSFGKRMELNRANWQAGMGDADHFTYRLMPQGSIVGGPIIADGTYDPASARGPGSLMARFFGKKRVTVSNVNPAAAP